MPPTSPKTNAILQRKPKAHPLAVSNRQNAQKVVALARDTLGVGITVHDLNFTDARVMNGLSQQAKAQAKLAQQFLKDFSAYVDARVELERIQASADVKAAEGAADIKRTILEMEKKIVPLLNKMGLDDQRIQHILLEGDEYSRHMSDYYEASHQSRMNAISNKVQNMLAELNASDELKAAFSYASNPGFSVVQAIGGFDSGRLGSAGGTGSFQMAGAGAAAPVTIHREKRAPGLNPLNWFGRSRNRRI